MASPSPSSQHELTASQHEFAASQLVALLAATNLPHRIGEIVRETAEHYDVSTCLLSFSDTSFSSSPLFFKAVHGPCAAIEGDRREGFNLVRCPYKREIPTVILRAGHDSRFAQDELVVQAPHANLCVGVPIVVAPHAGMRCFIGTLCL